MNRIYGVSLILALFFFGGCVSQKKLDELTALVKNLEARIEAIEKIIQPAKEGQPMAQHVDVPLDDSHVLGNKDAKIHIAVFSNFQCPYCAKADEALRKVLNDNELKDKVNIVFKHFPFPRHPEARPASKAALAAGEQGKFWEMTEKLFKHQNELDRKHFDKWAKEIGLDINKFNKDLKDNDKKYDDIINRDYALGEKIHLQGTPWILVNGWLLEGEATPENVKKIIKEKNLSDVKVPE